MATTTLLSDELFMQFVKLDTRDGTRFVKRIENTNIFILQDTTGSLYRDGCGDKPDLYSCWEYYSDDRVCIRCIGSGYETEQAATANL